MRTLSRLALAALCIVPLAGCAAGNLLHEYDFRNATVATVSDAPPRPDVLSGSLFDMRTTGDPLRDIMRVGARVVREVEAAEMQAKLDSASARIDLGYRLEDQTRQRAARYLGADPVEGTDGEYLLELIVVDYGVVADSWDAAAEFYVEADATLLHGASGAEIWRAEVSARDPVGPLVFGGAPEARDLMTAIVLATLDVDEMVQVLEGLADYTARIVTDRLRDDLRDARRR